MGSPESKAWDRLACKYFTKINDSKENVWVAVFAEQARRRCHYNIHHHYWLLIFSPKRLSDMPYEIYFRTLSREKTYLSTSSHYPLNKIYPTILMPQCFLLVHVWCPEAFYAATSTESPGWDIRNGSNGPGRLQEAGQIPCRTDCCLPCHKPGNFFKSNKQKISTSFLFFFLIYL